jgi:hypothetical protein
MNRASIGIPIVLFGMGLLGCMGGGLIRGELLRPPSMDRATMERLASRAAVLDNNWVTSIQPVGLRVYTNGAIAVDVMVVLDAEIEYRRNSSGISPLETEQESLYKAQYYTNGIGVPAALRSADKDGPAIEIRSGDGSIIKTARAIIPSEDVDRKALSDGGWERWGEWGGSHAGGAEDRPLEASRVVDIKRGGKLYRACFVGVLMRPSGPVDVGASYEVRILSAPREDREYFDEAWYPLVAEAVGGGGAR